MKEIGGYFSFELNKNYTVDDIYKVIVDKKKYQLNYPSMKSFELFIDPFIDSYLFDKRIIDISTAVPSLSIQNEDLIKENLIIKKLDVDNSIIKRFRASKKIDINSSKKNMEFGTKIHFLLEMIDFMNPNYSLINDDFYSSIIEDFLTSDLLKNIHNGKIYHFE